MKTVLVTGGNRGIGKEIVWKLLQRQNMNVIFTCRDSEKGEYIQNEFSLKVQDPKLIKYYLLDTENISFCEFISK